MVKNGLNSLRNSTSNLSLRAPPSEAESSAAARQRIADLEARIAQLQAREDTTDWEEFYRKFPPVVREDAAPFHLPYIPGGLRMNYKRADGSEYKRELPPRSPPAAPSPDSNQASLGEQLGPRGFAQRDPASLRSQPQPSLPAQSRASSIPAPFAALSPWAERDDPIDEDIPEKSLFEKYNESLQEQHNKPKRSLITKGLVREGNALKSPEAYTQPFCDFLTENPTVWHTVTYFEKKLEKAGFKKVGFLGVG